MRVLPNSLCIFSLVLSFASHLHGESDAPVVHHPGKHSIQRPSRTTILSPAIIRIDSEQNEREPRVPIPKIAEFNPIIPIGGVIAWMKSMTNTPALPPGWVECNGQEISNVRSPYHGMLVPNLNGASGSSKRFLRGAPETGASGGSSSHGHGGVRSQKYGTQRKPVASTVQSTHLPPYYDVNWIMRIR